MESTPLIVDDPNCWNDKYPAPARRSHPSLNCGDILLITNRTVQGVSNENLEEFASTYEAKHPSLKDPREFIEYIYEETGGDESLRSVRVSIMFLGQRTRDLTYMSEAGNRRYYKFLVSPSCKIYWISSATIKGLLVDKSLDRSQVLF